MCEPDLSSACCRVKRQTQGNGKSHYNQFLTFLALLFILASSSFYLLYFLILVYLLLLLLVSIFFFYFAIFPLAHFYYFYISCLLWVLLLLFVSLSSGSFSPFIMFHCCVLTFFNTSTLLLPALSSLFLLLFWFLYRLVSIVSSSSALVPL